MTRDYRVGEVAARTGVSVRALHHYDRIGLLQPSGHSDGGHRRYTEPDLLRLQQILTLRYLGFTLRRIGELLDRPDFDLIASLGVQRLALHDRISTLERIESVLGDLVEHRLATGQWAWDLVLRATATIQDGLVEKGTKMDAYYTPEQMEQFEALGREVPAGERERIERQWPALIEEITANLELDPASSEARTLMKRWDLLVQATFRGNTELMEAVGENYRRGVFTGQPGTPGPDVFAFVERVHQAQADPNAG